MSEQNASKHAVTWMHKVQSALWEYLWGAWNHCNKRVKGENQQEQNQANLQHTEQQINSVFDNNPTLLVEDSHLLKNRENILKRSNGGRKMWLRSIQLAIKKIQSRLTQNEREALKQPKPTYLGGDNVSIEYKQQQIEDYL